MEISDKGRLTQPLIRENGAHRPATWDKALDRVPQQMLGTNRGGMLRLTDLEQIIRAPVVRRRSDLLEADSSDATQPTPFAWRF